MSGEKHAEGIKKSINDIIGVNTSLKHKKKNIDGIKKDRFIRIINLLEEIEVRGALMNSELEMDFTSYNEKFYSVIDLMFDMFFSTQACELIFFYVYERTNPDGTINNIVNTQDNTIIPINSPGELWDILKIIEEPKTKTNK